MVTKEQALSSNTFHDHTCNTRGGSYTTPGGRSYSSRWRKNGHTITYKSPSRATHFTTPIKFGFSRNVAYSYITQDNADQFHTEEECPYNTITPPKP